MRLKTQAKSEMHPPRLAVSLVLTGDPSYKTIDIGPSFAGRTAVCQLTGMNPRHTAALALVGWYLICPPYHSPCWPGVETLRQIFGYGPGACEMQLPDYDAAISQWTESGEYDHVSDCEERSASIGNPVCKCIGTDDPRLK